ncbi:MAG: septum formation initiator family protein [bacterium]
MTIKNIKLKGVLAIIVVLISLFLVSLIKETYRNYKVNKEIEKLRSDIEVLRNENSELNYLIDYLNTDYFVEKEARVKFGLKKNGEKVFNIEGNMKDEQLENKSENSLEDISNIKKWRNYFFVH